MKEILITSSVLICVVLLLRLVLRKWVSRRLIYAAWLLVALRLLIPFQFGQSDYSVVAMAEAFGQQSEVIQQAEDAFRQPMKGPTQEEVYQTLVQDYLSNPVISSTVVLPEVQEQLWLEAEAQTSQPSNFSRLLTVVWVSGMVVTAGWFLITNLVFLRKVKKASTPSPQSNSKIPVRISKKVSTPCLTGLFRPVIYLTPDSTADPQGLNHVLTHELTHYRHGDHIWAWVRCLCLCIYWFDPLVWIAATTSKRDCELACDEAALKQLGESQRIPYGKTLLATVTHNSVRIFHTTTAMSESRKQLKERVNFIVKKPRNLLIAAISMVLIIAVTAGCAFLGGTGTETTAPSPTAPSQQIPSTEQTEPTTATPEQTEPTTATPEQTDVALIPNPHSLFPPDSPIVQTEGPSAAQLIAKEAVAIYRTYCTIGVCCEMERADDFPDGHKDMSQYLTEAQKEEYFNCQYRITCCKTIEEVHDHIDRHIGKDVQHDYTDKNLFTDDEGNLYIIVIPTSYDNYRHYEVLSQTKDEIICRACGYFEPECDDSDIFTLKASNNGYLVTNVERDSEYICEAVLLEEAPNYQLYKHGNTGYSGMVETDRYGTLYFQEDFYCPAVKLITENLWEITTDYGNGFVRRIYYGHNPKGTKYNSSRETYDYAIALGHGKIAYLEGELNERTLVICDLFDRTTAQSFTDLGFKAENMPVTAATFSENDTQLTLTYFTDQNTETNVTLKLIP